MGIITLGSEERGYFFQTWHVLISQFNKKKNINEQMIHHSHHAEMRGQSLTFTIDSQRRHC